MKYEFDMYLARKDAYAEGRTNGMRETALRVIRKLTEAGTPLAEAESIAGMTLQEAEQAAVPNDPSEGV